MHVPHLRGWKYDFGEKSKSKYLCMLDLDFTNACNLNCPYCYRAEYGIMNHKKLNVELKLSEFYKIVDQAKELGCSVIKIVGAGEPTIDPEFYEKITYISGKDMIPVVFTNGTTIADNKDIADFLFRSNASVILKVNSFASKTQDIMVGMPGYSKKVSKALKILIKMGFNKGVPTRFGFDSVITSQNVKDIYEMFRYCRKHNIFPVFKSFIPTGNALKMKDWELSREKLVELLEELRKIDEKEFGIIHDGSLPYAGGFPCRQLHHALYIDVEGNVYPCPGSRKLLGNVRKETLKSIWNGQKMLEIRNTDYYSCPPREEYWKSR